MSARSKHVKPDDVVVEDANRNRGKNFKKKSPPAFVPLDGLSQSAKDRRMNNRTVKPPKNLILIEGDPEEAMDSKKKLRDNRNFPNEHVLSSKIKEVNGMDFSNHFIEEHYRRYRSRSISPEICEESTNSSSVTTNESMRSSSQEESCSSMGIENSYIENDTDSFDQDGVEDMIRTSRYCKNAAIIGMLKQNIISLNDLELDSDEKKNFYSEIQEIVENKNDKDNSMKVNEFVNLVPHPDDPEVFTHPLQAHGKLDDAGIDFRLPRIGDKSILTPRQFFISEGLNEEKFEFSKPPKAQPKSKHNINFPQMSPTRSTRNPTYCNDDSPSNENYLHGESSNSYDLLVNDENNGFIMNCEEFPTLKR